MKLKSEIRNPKHEVNARSEIRNSLAAWLLRDAVLGRGRASAFAALWLVGGACCAPLAAHSEATDTNSPLCTATVEADLNSRYIWRGLALSSGAVLQPSLALSAYDFTFTTWLNYDLALTPEKPRWNETDLTLGYSRSVGRWTFGATVQSYLYPSSLGVPNTAEAVLPVGYELGDFALLLRQTVDVAAYPGAYYGELAPGWTHDLGHGFEVSTGATLAWATDRFTEAYAGVAAGGFYLVGVEAALRWSCTKHLTLRPHLAMSHLLTETMQQSVGEPNFIWGGVALTLELP